MTRRTRSHSATIGLLAALAGLISCRRAPPAVVAPAPAVVAPAPAAVAPPPAALDLRGFVSAVWDLEQARSCGWFDRCCTAPERARDPVRDHTLTCEPARRSQLRERIVSDYEARVRAGTLAFYPASARACLDAAGVLYRSAAVACGDFAAATAAAPEWEVLPECARYLHGTAPAGTPCRSRRECLAGLVCAATGPLSDPATQTLCTAPRSVGAECQFGDQCPASTVCLEGHCQARRGEGGACTSGARECERGMSCAMGPTESSGVCRARRAAGEACRDEYDCRSGLCADGRCAAVCAGA